MAVADVEAGVKLRGKSALEQIRLTGLFAALAAFTLCTLDAGEVAPRIISAAALLLAAFCLCFPIRRRTGLNVPITCLGLMSLYGVVQTLWFPQKILFQGWSAVLFWSTATAICFVATQVFEDPANAGRFLKWFVLFGSAICLLDLLEQASHTNRYFWVIPSKYSTVNGSFAYWNNFAQLVELCLPATLWLAIRGREVRSGFLLLGALQLAAVIASGSRAGSALVVAEALAVLLLAYVRQRRKSFLYAAAAMAALTLVFVYAAGADALGRKLEERDQLAARRDINKSSLEMIRQHPLTGWGLGTYVPLYRMFARYDDGSYVNRAHNDWLEWTAEGGVFFSGLMLIVFLWSIKPAIRSVWGIGLIALCLHAAVDYPFARLGVCGWYFALAGMLAEFVADRDGHRARFRQRTLSSC